MSIPFAINGLGRVGRALLRRLPAFPGLELVAVNDLAPVDSLARLIARDSIYGAYPGSIVAEGGDLVLEGRRISVFREQDPAQIPWHTARPRIVVEATGASRTGAFARAHLRNSVERVVTAWNPKDPKEVDLTLCMGINEGAYRPESHRLISNASCTTHCIAPLARVLHENWGLRRGLVNSVHGVTNNQSLLDASHPEPRRARSGMLNMVPTASHAAEAVGSILPQLAGRLRGFVVRVPAPHAALLDLVVELERPAEEEEIRDVFRREAEGPMAGILAVTEEELVSGDFVGTTHSAVVDLPLVQSVEGGLIRLVAWYDNEWGYATRLAEVLEFLGEAGPTTPELKENSRVEGERA